MTKYVHCTVVDTDRPKKPSPTQPQTSQVYLTGVSESGPINIKKHFIGKYQMRQEWYLPRARQLDQYV